MNIRCESPRNKVMSKKHRPFLKRLKNDWLLYLMLLLVLAWYIIFCYAPMGGLVLAFKRFSFKKGIWGSDWIGLENFRKMLSDRDFIRAIRNTVILGVGKLVFQLPAGVAMALLLNEVRYKSKKIIQTTATFPHFISWVVLSGIVINLFSSTGLVNQLLMSLGLERTSILTNTKTYQWFVWFGNIWKEIGWDSIIYLAAITSVEQGLYEAAAIDGANRWKQLWHVTLPGIRGTVCTMLILSVGQIISNGYFDQIYNTYSATVYEVADTLDTYIFRESFTRGGMNFGYSTAIGLFKSVIALIMVAASNKVVTKAGEEGLL